VLRKLFGEPGALAEWGLIREPFASRVLQAELVRVIHRIRLAGEIDDEQVAQLQEEGRRVLRSVGIVALSERSLERAAGPMPTALGALAAIHLATALELSAHRPPGIAVATHDVQLARAARASGLEVIGS